MNVVCKKSELSGRIVVPGSKSHTIRALLLAALSDGKCKINNPLPSADGFSAAHAIKAFGAKVDIGCEVDKKGYPLGKPASVWFVEGVGENAHLPNETIDVGNSGSVLYFFTPVAATFAGTSTFTGDESICKRPVNHLLDALRQLGCEASVLYSGVDSPPFSVTGPLRAGKVVTDGTLSQYISGLMMASCLVEGEIDINLIEPKETPYLTMTQQWLESVGHKVHISDDFSQIVATGKHKIVAFDRTIPSDWEGVAFPAIAAVLSGSDIVVEGVDLSGSQGDDEIVDVLKALGVPLEIWETDKNAALGNLHIYGRKVQKMCVLPKDIEKARNERIEKRGSCSFYEKNGELFINLSGWPDAVCALSVLAAFVDGTVVLEDLGVCRKKETDRLKVMTSELKKLGVNIEEGEDFLRIVGKGLDGNFEKNVTVESFDDHRVAMSLACFGWSRVNSTVEVRDAECSNVSFPDFFEKMTRMGAKIR
ncbi:MAG: 3-phosphoshikimate 1-carboxyvinyltransferase [Treponema sp.]|nr:3-phosphoshikimate 1-carboxyvinyltransferase [Treponema sp.]